MGLHEPNASGVLRRLLAAAAVALLAVLPLAACEDSGAGGTDVEDTDDDPGGY